MIKSIIVILFVSSINSSTTIDTIKTDKVIIESLYNEHLTLQDYMDIEI